MSEKVLPKLSAHERKLLREISTHRYWRVKHGYRGTGTHLIKIASARALRQRGLAREAIGKTNRGSYPFLQITGLGQDMLENRVSQERLL